MRQPNQEDLDILRQAVPYLRSLVAFIVYLRTPSKSLGVCYEKADEFVGQLDHDVRTVG